MRLTIITTAMTAGLLGYILHYLGGSAVSIVGWPGILLLSAATWYYQGRLAAYKQQMDKTSRFIENRSGVWN